MSELRKHFDEWHVPSDQDFADLIDVAALSFQPGNGLAGGDPSKSAGVVAVDKITALVVKTAEKGGLSASRDGVMVEVKGGGLKRGPQGQVCVEVGTDKGVTAEGPGVAVQAVQPLIVKDVVSLNIDKGLKWVGNTVSLNADGKSVALNPETGVAYVKCAENGGLKIDDKGNLTVDLDNILKSS
ncbi:hypothetical protein WT08_28145 [Burkholderia sp. MSMB1552]|nr:hypothetical protein WT08_28145 [Burkholderia sp. MSMB1552]KWZ46946.1 hypothetical protein WS92_29845 [Burkholderia sp. MSMB1588]